jgi:hypothetical protein
MNTPTRYRAEYKNLVLIVAEKNGKWYARVVTLALEIGANSIWGSGGLDPNSESFEGLRDAQEHACREALARTGEDDDKNCADFVTWKAEGSK